MKEHYHLSATEQQIMEKLWGMSGPVRQTLLLAMFNEEGKNWGRQTLNTLLIRLEHRGFVSRGKRMVSASYTREQFGALIVREALDNYLNGDIDLYAAQVLPKNP